MVEVTQVHMSGGTQHQHIAEVRWRDPANQDTGASSREEMVRWLRASESNQAYVSNGSRRAYVGVVNAQPPYIRTHADGVWTDNLLALPSYQTWKKGEIGQLSYQSLRAYAVAPEPCEKERQAALLTIQHYWTC